MPSTTRFRGQGGRFQSSKGYFSTNTLERGIAQFEMKMRQGIMEFAEDFAREIEEYARANAPWEDRTGDARAGLTAEAQETNSSTTITLYHTVEYGVWLEIRWSGKYAIVLPTLEKMGPKLFNRMEGMMDRIEFYE